MLQRGSRRGGLVMQGPTTTSENARGHGHDTLAV